MPHDIATHARDILRAATDVLERVDPAESRHFRDSIREAAQVFVAGAGRTGYITRCFAMRLMHLGLSVHVVGEATAPAPTRDDLLLVFSGSGETISSTEVAARASEFGVPILGVTANPESKLAGLARRVLVLPALPSDFPLGTLFEAALFAFLDATFMALKDDLGVSEDQMSARHALG